MMKKKLLSVFTLTKAFNKGIRGNSKFWRYSFFVTVIFKILKWIFSKPLPEKVQEVELAPGEYKITVTDTNGVKKGKRKN